MDNYPRLPHNGHLVDEAWFAIAQIFMDDETREEEEKTRALKKKRAAEKRAEKERLNALKTDVENTRKEKA